MALPDGQAHINRQFYRLIFTKDAAGLRLGEATRMAKAVVSDFDVRRTWILLGDPSMRLR
jgi:hypothetical protein